MTPSFGVRIHLYIHEHTPYAPNSYTTYRELEKQLLKI